MATTMTVQKPALRWLQTFKRYRYFFKFAIIVTCAVGMFLHLTRLFIGIDLLLRYVATRTFDKIFFWPMLYAGLSSLLVAKRVIHSSIWHKAFWWVIVVYILVISAPIHARTYLTNSTEYLRAFPDWYSVLFLIWIVLMTLFIWRVQLKDGQE